MLGQAEELSDLLGVSVDVVARGVARERVSASARRYVRYVSRVDNERCRDVLDAVADVERYMPKVGGMDGDIRNIAIHEYLASESCGC